MAVEIEWIDSISPQATGNKIYRDTVPSTGEVEIADVPNGTQFYSDGTVAEGTEYKFEVQAHDGAGDETTQEVEGENMDYITTASLIVDLFPQTNAASTNEVDATTDWIIGGSSTITSDPDAHAGLRSIKILANGTDYPTGNIDLTYEVGATYRVTFWYKCISPTTAQQAVILSSATSNWEAPSVLQDLTATVWTEYTVDKVAAGADCRVEIRADRTSGTTTNAILIDLMTIVKVS